MMRPLSADERRMLMSDADAHGPQLESSAGTQ
jgi:hypothetical protein